MQSASVSSVVLAIGVATLVPGCGSLMYEDSIHVGGRLHASATVHVEGAAVQSRTEGGVVIVEQAPGQGFVLAGGAPAIDATLSGFEGSTTTWTEASGGSGADVVLVSASHGGLDGGSNGGLAVGVGGGGGANFGAGGTGLDAGSSGGGSIAGSSDAPAGGLGGSASGGGSIAGGDAPAGGVGGSASGGGLVAAGGSVGVDVGVGIEVPAEVPRDGVHGLDGRPTGLTALIDRGVQVDGIGVSLAELEALADLRLDGSRDARLSTDGALEAWAELEHEALPRSGGETHVVVRVRAPETVAAPRGRLRVHLVIDRSSSMQRSWPRVLDAARLLIHRLQPDDELHIVAYGTDAIEAWPVGRVGDGRAAIAALEGISVGGGTHIEAGLRMAYGRAARVSGQARGLVILLSDGVPNHGAFEPAELGALAGGACAASGVTTSVIGLGTEFDARLLRSIARQGRGGYHVSATVEGLSAGLVAELDAHSRAAAHALSVNVRLPAGVELLERSNGVAIEGGVRLSVPYLDVGEERSLVLRVRVGPSSRPRAIAEVDLDYRSGLDGRAVHDRASLEVSFGPRAIASQEGSQGLLDAHLSSALDAAGRAILEGETGAAVAALVGHADLAEGRVEVRRSARAQARVRVVRRMATALEALVPGASHGQRRQVSLAFGGLAARLER